MIDSRQIAQTLIAVVISVSALCAPSTASAQKKATPTAIARDAAFWSQPAGAVKIVFADELERAILVQRDAWMKSELAIHGQYERSTIAIGARNDINVDPNARRLPLPPNLEYYARRLANSWCYSSSQEIAWSVFYTTRTRIQDRQTTRALCPDWIPEVFSNAENVGPSLKNSQLVQFPVSIETGLDSAIRIFPKEVWFVDQLVRIATENAHYEIAFNSVNGCSPGNTWCGLLRAYTNYSQGKNRTADSLFQFFVSRLPPVTRCQWQSVAPLLSDAYAITPLQKSCDGPQSVNETLWWLATPLFSEQLNSRRDEHYARLVRATLEAELRISAQHDLRSSKGGEVVTALHARYGWPNRSVYVGPYEELQHSRSLHAGDSTAPYPAPEYDIRRSVSAFPKPGGDSLPFTVSDSSYQLMAPTDSSRYRWWPSEHFQHPNGAIQQVTEYQRAFLRRDTSSIALFATNLRGGLLDSIADTPVRASLVYSRAPDAVQFLDQKTARRGDRVVLRGELVGAGIAGFEYLVGAHGLAGARSRLGVATPLSTRSLSANSCAISDPILTDASAITGHALNDAHAGMFGSLALNRPTQFGVVWESYGFNANDTTSIAIHIVSTAEIGRLRRVGIALGVADDPTASVTIGWKEPQGAASASTDMFANGGRVPIAARELTIDVSQLRKGDYILEIRMENRACASVRSERAFSVAR